MEKIKLAVLCLALNSILSFALVGDSSASSNYNKPRKLGVFKITYYYIVSENDFPGTPKDVPIRNRTGKVLARVNKKFNDALAIEGTGQLTDGRTISYVAYVDGESRYAVSKMPWGYGLGTCDLKPFKTIAVDPRVIEPGSVVQIDETVGMRMDDGTIHDGLWIAEDVGSAIKGKHLDLFVGTKDEGSLFSRNKIRRWDHMHVTLVSAPHPPRGLSCLHGGNWTIWSLMPSWEF